MVSAGSNSFSDNVKIFVELNGITADALIDTGSTHNYIDFNYAKQNNITFDKSEGSVSMANTTLSSQIEGSCKAELIIQDCVYSNSFFYVMKNLVSDVIIGEDILKLHKSVTFHFNGTKPALNLCSILPTANTGYPNLFEHLTPDCQPVATKSRQYSKKDTDFIRKETKKLFDADRVEKSNSPWRSQPLVVHNDFHRDRMVIDYSPTINRYTL